MLVTWIRAIAVKTGVEMETSKCFEEPFERGN